MADVLLRDGDQICGFPAIQAGYAARTVDALQWCSAGALARGLQVSPPEARALLLAMEAGGYLTRHTGPLAGRGAWLPDEGTGPEPLLLWHLTSLRGMQLAKAHIGSQLPRAAAEALLEGFLDRVRAVNRDLGSTHVIESVMLYGSVADPDRQEVTDVDLIVFAERRCRAVTEEQALVERARLQTLLRAGHDRLDIAVVDGLSDNQSPLPPGSIRKCVFP
jgi:predicted nucleotidyltransferase